MKPLISTILLLLGASATLSTRSLAAEQSTYTADGQKLAEFARLERSRRGSVTRASAVYTSKDFRPAPPAPPPTAADLTKPAADEEKKPEVDLVKEWSSSLSSLQAEIQKLKDLKTTLQNQLNAVNDALYSPVTNSSAQAEAQTKVTDIQKKIVDNLKDLAEAQSKLEKLAAAGPPKK